MIRKIVYRYNRRRLNCCTRGCLRGRRNRPRKIVYGNRLTSHVYS
jgi:hypothetical protein